MHDWVVSTRRDAATGRALTESYTDADGVVHTHDTSDYRLAKFKMEFKNHFDMHYSLIYYVYTFFALMVDQRAKNMFLTYWGSLGKWQPWFYDNDTCFGINNEGQLVLDYYHEDTDLLEGANVYNGQNSVLWCNFRDAFPSEIKSTYQNLRSNSILNYDELVEQFITKGSDKWSESIYNEDADFKYISMLHSDNDASNLGQVRGTGEEHLQYFFENRLNYCDGKWYAADYADDYVALRIYTPNTWAGVEPNANITVTPYSHMYAGVRYKANGTLYQQRAEANDPVTFVAPNETFNDTETAIYGASQLSSLGDLSPLYCGSINVSKATKLTELIIGSSARGYSNLNLNDLSVGTNNLLKTINVRNCPKLTDPLVLSGCQNIEYIYAGGSGITGIELAPSGYVKVLELPATLSNLTLTNQPYIESLTLEGYDSIKTLWLENCPTINSLNLLHQARNVERARLTNVNWSYEDTSALYELIDRNIAGIDENGTNIEHMWIDGTCHITSLTGAEYKEIRELYPYLKLTYDTLTSQLVYMNEDGTVEIHRETITNKGNGVEDPVATGTIETPTKESTAQYNFTYSGWSLTPGGNADANALIDVEGDRTVYVAFDKELRSYTVNFYDGETTLYTETVFYGFNATYSTTPTPSNEYLEFRGWKPEPVNISGDLNCYAQWYDMREISDDWATIAAACNDGSYVDKYQIGAYKPVEINYEDGTSETIDFEIIAQDHDELADGECRWEPAVANMGFRFEYGCVVVYNNKIHGFNGSNHNCYDGVAWTNIDTAPFTANYNTAVVYNDKIHAFANAYHYTWDETNGWVEIGNLLVNNVRNGSAVVCNGCIHLFDGYGYQKSHCVYDGTSWTRLANTSNHVVGGNAVVFNDEIYIYDAGGSLYKYNGSGWDLKYEFGGNGSRHNIFVYDNNMYVKYDSKVYIYDGTVITETSFLPYKAIGYPSVVYRDELHQLGFYDTTIDYSIQAHWKYAGARFVYQAQLGEAARYGHWSMYNDTVYNVYNTSVNTLNMSTYKKEALPNLPKGNAGHGKIVEYNGRIHVFTCTHYTDESCYFHYVYDDENQTWVEQEKGPINNYGCNVIASDDRIYHFNTWNSSIRTYDDVNGWSEPLTKNVSFSNNSVTIHNGELHGIGGGSSKEIYRYSLTDSTFVKVCDLPYNLNGCTLLSLNNRLYCVGGTTTPNSVHEFDGEKWNLLTVDTRYYYANKDTIYSPSTMWVYRNKIYIIYTLGIITRLENPRAPLTFLAKNLLRDGAHWNATTKEYNGKKYYNAGGWQISDVRTHLNETVYASLPDELRNVISTVIKVSDTSPSDQNLVDVTDTLWLPSAEEMGASSSNASIKSGQGMAYPVFTDNTSRIRAKLDSASEIYSLRTTNIKSNIHIFGVKADGTIDSNILVALNNSNYKGPFGVLPGFCI